MVPSSPSNYPSRNYALFVESNGVVHLAYSNANGTNVYIDSSPARSPA